MSVRAIKAVFVVATVVLFVVPIADVFGVHSRAADWDAATNKLVAGTNYHGGVDDPNGQVWTYHWQNGQPTYGGYLTTLVPSAWYDLNTNITGVSYGFEVNYQGDPAVPVSLTRATRDRVGLLWHSTYTPELDRRPAWIISEWKAPGACTISLDGILSWQLGYTAGSTYAYSIGTLSGGVYTPLFEGNGGSTSAPAKDAVTIVADLGDIAALQNIVLGANDTLLIGLRGSTYNYRMVTWDDSAVTIAVCKVFTADINNDCKVDMQDFAEFAKWWLHCTKLNCP